MGRAVRRVPPTWDHPADDNGYRPLYDSDVEAAWHEWLAEYREGGEDYAATCAYMGRPPDPDYYRPRWADKERTHYQMYETVSEGTPLSPPMESPEELARWLTDNDANAGAGMTASYEAWLRVCKGGYAPSMVLGPGGLKSGVEGFADPAGV